MKSLNEILNETIFDINDNINNVDKSVLFCGNYEFTDYFTQGGGSFDMSDVFYKHRIKKDFEKLKYKIDIKKQIGRYIPEEICYLINIVYNMKNNINYIEDNIQKYMYEYYYKAYFRSDKSDKNTIYLTLCPIAYEGNIQMDHTLEFSKIK